ncbi:MAG: ATP phosphoribosyltransferase regulatory subunit [Lachnospiraceae bacterium]|nr:ATP phosphoribosyltransferase regulatory subunit [Lachnospiraceae bacterium]
MDRLLHTPDGVRDIYGDECAGRKLMKASLVSELHLYGYKDIETPEFEFFDVFNTDRGTVSSREMFKMTDRTGDTLVLRPDITPSIARAVSKYYQDETIPLRFAYSGNVFRSGGALQGKMRQTTQIGAELVGDPGIEGDAEIISLAVSMMLRSGLTDFQIDIGHVGFFRALAKESALDGDSVGELRELIESKNYFGIESYLEDKGIKGESAAAFIRMPELFGSDDTLDKARALTSSPAALEVLDYLDRLYDIVKDYGFEKYVTIDLGMLSEYNYYTGIIFKGYTYGSGDPVIQGGRYDRLIGQFGKEAASVGFAVLLDELLLALSRQHIDIHVPEPGVMILFEEGFREKAIREAGALRSEGISVTVLKRDPDRAMEDYEAYCKNYSIGRIEYIDC